MRLRSTLLLVLIVVCVAMLGAWTDKPKVQVDAAPMAAPTRPWDALVEISRRGRRLDGFRPVLEIEGLRGGRTIQGKEVSAGTYRVRVLFPHPGIYTYTVKVADRVAYRGSVYAMPN